MKVKKEFVENPLKLTELGFDYMEVENCYGDKCYETEGKLVYDLGHSRRGQYYYLIIEDDRTISVFATKPDGDGTSIELDDILFELFENNMLEK